MKTLYINFILNVSLIIVFTACKNEHSPTTLVTSSKDQLKTVKVDTVNEIEQIKNTEGVKPPILLKDTVSSSAIIQKERSKVKQETKPKKVIKKKRFAKIDFETYEYDFGKIEEGDTIDYKFKFKNVGDATLEIAKAKATCGCTQPSYPFLGINKNEEGFIGVRYISVGKSGPQEATITITSNAVNAEVELYLKGNVVPRKKKS